MIYLDNAATTRVSPEVAEAIRPYIESEYGNPGSPHCLGRTARQAVEHARRQVASFLKAPEDHIVFTSGGSEANNLALRAAASILGRRGNVHVTTTATEHASVLRTAESYEEANESCSVSLVPPEPTGEIHPQKFDRYLPDWRLSESGTGFASVMYVNNETGAVNDVAEIARRCSAKGVLFHTDCVQAAGTLPLDVERIGCDFMSVSAHKIHGLKGTGALYIRDKSMIKPLIYGGTNQEYGLRGGTENVVGIVAFGAACEETERRMEDDVNHTSTLKQIYFNVLTNRLREYGLDSVVGVNGPPVITRGKIINLRFDGIDGETLLYLLETKGVCVSAGSACTNHSQNPSYVLLAMGVSPEDARNSIRVSFSRYNTEAETKEAAEITAQCVRTLHELCGTDTQNHL